MTVLDLTKKLEEKKKDKKMLDFLNTQLDLMNSREDFENQNIPDFSGDESEEKSKKALRLRIDNDPIVMDRIYRADQSFRGSRGTRKISGLTYRDLSDIMALAYIRSSNDTILQILDDVNKLRYHDVYSVDPDEVDILKFFNEVLDAVDEYTKTKKET